MGVAVFVSCFLVSIAGARNIHGRGPTPGSSATSPSSSTPVAAPSETAVLSFDQIQQMTPCQPASITWTYQGPLAPLTLTVTDQDVTQSTSDTQSQAEDSCIMKILSTTVVPSAQIYTWYAVTVPQGHYVVQASVLTFRAQSQPFYVTNSSDTSCLLFPSTPISPASPSPSNTPASYTNVPSSRVNCAAIAGIMGGLAAAAAAIVIFFLCRKSRGARNLPADAWEGPDPENMTDKPAKSGLKGGMDNDFPSIPPSRRQSLIQRSNRTGVTAGRTFKSTDTLKEVISPSSPSQNKFAVPAETFSGVRSSVDTFVESIPALPYNSDHRRWSVSVQYAENANYSRPRSANSSGNSMNVNRVMNRGDSVDGHNGYSRRSSVDGHNGYSPPASGEGERPGSRPGSGHSSIHRTRRKPVPAYDPLELSSAPTVHNEHPNSNADGLLSEHHSHTVNSTDPVNQRNMVGSNHKGNSGEIPPNRSVDNPNPDMPTPSEC